MRIAEVVINTDVRSLDRVFHYLYSDDMNVQRFCRVEVPFGPGNKPAEGLVIGFASESPYKKLKFVSKLIDQTPIIGESSYKAALFVSRTCFCPLYMCLKLVLPPKSSSKFITTAVLTDITDIKLTVQQSLITDILRSTGGRMEVNSLLAATDSKGMSILKTLQDKGVIELETSSKQGIGEKYRLICSLLIDADEAEQILSEIKGSAKKKAVQTLTEYGSLPLQDLLELAGCSAASVKSLEKSGIVTIEQQEISRSPIMGRKFAEYRSHKPTPEQLSALTSIKYATDNGSFQTMLLHGVTGSGKTEVFLQAAEYCAGKGRRTIVLVPEIGLTPQMVERFAGRFGSRVAVLHSGLSLGERYDEWHRIRSGEVDIVVGARSAVFAPIENIGLIVVDEEHENSYKSDTAPRYHARDVAAFRAKDSEALLLLASATPSFESYYAAKSGRFRLLELNTRYNAAPMPDISVVDMSAELLNGNRSAISVQLREAIEENLRNGMQTVLYLNRRGHSTFVSCRNCGNAISCPHCSVTLTYHSEGNLLVCHYCGHRELSPSVCPKCGSKYIRMFGTGTQKVEEEINTLFPGASVQRMDADTTSGKNMHADILRRFGEGKIDILLGTQMVAKGLDFPNVTLVGVLAADTLLNLNDFRAAERAFCQLVQVCGRSGRGEIAGRAIIQTYSPDNITIQLAKEHDYKEFYRQEIELRRQLEYPPFGNMVCIMFKGMESNETAASATITADVIIKNAPEGSITAVYGPSAAPIARLGGMYRFRLLFKYNTQFNIRKVVKEAAEKHITGNYAGKVFIDIDVNPSSLY